MDNWYEEFAKVSQATPEGELFGFNGEEVVLHIEPNKDGPPFIYARAFVPEIVDTPPEWKLQTLTTMSFHGRKCVLLPRARTELLKKAVVNDNKILVKGLRIVRGSVSGKSLLCEVIYEG